MNDPISNTEIIRWIVGGVAANFVGIIGAYVNIIQRIAIVETQIQHLLGFTKRIGDKNADNREA